MKAIVETKHYRFSIDVDGSVVTHERSKDAWGNIYWAIYERHSGTSPMRVLLDEIEKRESFSQDCKKDFDITKAV